MKVILTESQIKEIAKMELLESVLAEDENTQEVMNAVSNAASPDEAYKLLAKAIRNGYITMPSATFILARVFGGSPVVQRIKQLLGNLINKDTQVTNQMETDAQEQAGIWKNNFGDWKLVSNDTIATVYNAVPSQCNNDIVHTASMFKLNLKDVLSQRVIAMERTFMKELGLKYGDVVYVEGVGKWNGPWQIQDTMNKRFAGMHKIDILVPNNVKHGKWDGVKIFVPVNEKTAINAKNIMAGSI